MDESLDELTQMAAREALKDIFSRSYENDIAKVRMEHAILGTSGSPQETEALYLLAQKHGEIVRKLDAQPPKQIGFATPQEPPKPLPPAGEEDISDISDPGILWQIAKRKDYTK